MGCRIHPFTTMEHAWRRSSLYLETMLAGYLLSIATSFHLSSISLNRCTLHNSGQVVW